MKYHAYWNTLSIVSCFLLFAHASLRDDFPTFIAPENIFRVVAHNETGDVYVGGRNVLYHLGPDLKVKQIVSTGPQLDHPLCPHPMFPCEHEKKLTNNGNELLEIAYHLKKPMLLFCGTLYIGLCQVRSLDDISVWSWVGPYNERVGFTFALDTVNRGFFGPGYGQKQALYVSVGSSFDNKDYPDFLSSRMLVQKNGEFVFEYSFSNNKSLSAVNLNTKSERVPVYGFVHGKFAYFVMMHKNPLNSDGSKSMLARVCIEDGTFHSYTELPIACEHNGKIYNYALDGYLGPASTQLRAVGKPALYVTFIRFEDATITGSAICGYPMSSLIEAFTDVTKDCFKGLSTVNLLDPLSGINYPCQKKDVSITEDFCGSDFNRYISGQKRIHEKFLAYIPTAFTAIAVTRQNGETVAFAGTSVGYLFKLHLEKADLQLLNINYLLKEDSSEIRAPLVFDPSHEHLYVYGGNKLVKFPINTCSTYETCNSCLVVGKQDPLVCGWCDGQCTNFLECENLVSFSDDTCSPIISEVTPLKGHVNGGTSIIITGHNFGLFIDDDHNSVLVADIPCRILHWGKNSVNCITSPASTAISGYIQLNVDDTSDPDRGYTVQGSVKSVRKFGYVVPKLYGIYPGQGPRSGGSNVTIFGKYLNAGTQHSISICGQQCKKIGFSRSIAWCITPKATSSECNKPIEVRIDTAKIEIESHIPLNVDLGVTLSQTFMYISDTKTESGSGSKRDGTSANFQRGQTARDVHQEL